ncbi:MAG: hypothetical protein P4L64_15215 [Caulobacteraceae bacterium]|nr:hypothetical protein [Caulobacteraceae bacterium]
MAPREAEAEAGFAAVDALVALMILATTIILSLGAVSIARRASANAVEARRAEQLLRGLIDSAPHRVSAASGRQGGFDWRVDIRADAGAALPAGVSLCQRSAQVRAEGSGRRYALAGSELCRPPGAAS